MENISSLFAPEIALTPSDWKDAASWQFEAFALHLHETHCTRCSSVSHHSDAYRMFTKRFAAAVDRRFIPATSIPETLQVITFKLPVRSVPICHHCLTADRQGTQTILISSERAWQDGLRQQRDLTAKQATKQAKVFDPSTPIPSLF